MAQINYDKIREALKEDQAQKDSQNKQAADIGVSQTWINKFVNEERAGMSVETLLKACLYLGKCPLLFTTDGYIRKIAPSPLQSKLVKICRLIFHDDFPFGEEQAFELLGLQVENLYNKYCGPKGKTY